MNCDVYVCQTIYHLYQTLLLTCNGDKKVIVILTDFTKGLVDYKERLKIIPNIHDVIYIENEKIEIKIKSKNVFEKIFLLSRYKENILKEYNLNYPELNDLIKNSSVKLFVDKSFIGHYCCFVNERVTLLDDGEANYFPNKFNIMYFIKHHIFSIPFGRGRSRYIKSVHYREPCKVPPCQRRYIGKKLFSLDLNLLEQGLTNSDKEYILDFFGVLSIQSKNEHNCILFTQPFSEDGFISEDMKISIYANIVKSKLKQGYLVYVKPHPRESTNYEAFLGYSNVIVLSSLFPSEVFNIIKNFSFDEGIAIQSTALSTANYIEKKHELGYSSYPELMKGKEKIDNVVLKR
ncbi:polysialyltransferase family glycosyltransferase [Vibrio cyclitrophicus]